jgi:GntR family transcriptional regulator/MocR family aminotransferase
VEQEWATFGADLHLELSGTGVRGRAALERVLRDAVQSGRLHPGTRLPSSRALARDIGVARNTIVEAYGQLVAEGWLTAVTGSGTRVADRVIEAPAPARDGARPAPGPARDGARPAPAARTARYDLRPGHPDLSAFPRAAWLAAARRSLNAAPTEALGYGDPRGRPELRRALAGYLARARGARTDPERIVVCTGFTQALGLICAVLGGRGAGTVAVEEYGHRSHRRLVTARGLRTRAAPIDAQGAVVDAFGSADAALLTPAHQFPLGMALAPERRTRAVRWATDTGALIVEDDYDGEFRYDRQAVGALQALAPESVVYAGTASKTLAPGVRLAWLVLPAALVDEVAAEKAGADRHTGVLDQLTLADLIGSGGYDRHVRRCRLMYRRRRDRLVAMLADRAPRARVTGLAAGMHAVVELPPGRDEEDVVARAAARGLALQGLGDFGPEDGGPGRAAALVVGYGTPPAHAFTSALARLAAALAD